MMLSEALSGPVHSTVNNCIPPEVPASRDGVDAIIRMLANFNPVTYAQEVSYAYAKLSGVMRGEEEDTELKRIDSRQHLRSSSI